METSKISVCWKEPNAQEVAKCETLITGVFALVGGGTAAVKRHYLERMLLKSLLKCSQ